MTTDHTTRRACTSSTKYTSDEVRFFLGLVMGRRWCPGPGLGWVGPTGPARLTDYWYDRPLSRPARKFFRGSAGARPGPSNFLRMGRDPA